MARKPRDLGRQDPDCTARYHGTRSAYDKVRCRCPHALTDHRRYRKHWEARILVPRLVPSHGTRRRLQALAALGWSYVHLAEYLECKKSNVKELTCPSRDNPWVYRETHERVKALYERLSMTLPPPSRPTAYMRTAARKRGWVPPLAWDDIDDLGAVPHKPRKPDRPAGEMGPVVDLTVDDAAVERACSGRLAWSKLTAGERTAAVTRLARRGKSDRAIGGLLQVNPQAVLQWRRRYGIPNGYREAAA